jgi:hypothetical protein
MIAGREVPSKFADEFLQDIDKDPKFARFHQRTAAAEALSELRAERLDLKAPDSRTLALVLLAGAVAVVATLYSPRPWFNLVALGVALVFDEVRVRRSRYLRDKRIVEIESQVEQLEAVVAEIDREAASSIKIIDPATFAQPKKKLEEKRSNGS